VKRAAYRAYGINSHQPGRYEVDHLISLELGGSNALANLWPEAALPKPGFHEKDRVENHLHARVCSGALTLAQAQRRIATNWLAVYRKLPAARYGRLPLGFERNRRQVGRGVAFLARGHAHA
jgi:hypothetical protein